MCVCVCVSGGVGGGGGALFSDGDRRSHDDGGRRLVVPISFFTGSACRSVSALRNLRAINIDQ